VSQTYSEGPVTGVRPYVREYKPVNEVDGRLRGSFLIAQI
jgi:hypothetical protein